MLQTEAEIKPTTKIPMNKLFKVIFAKISARNGKTLMTSSASTIINIPATNGNTVKIQTKTNFLIEKKQNFKL